MVDITITPANVVSGAGAKIEQGHAGETLVAGKWVYRDPTTKKYMLADADSATPAVRSPRGVTLCGSSLNQPLFVQTEGEIIMGGTLVAGVASYLSKTPGGMCPVADIAAGGYSTVLGMAKSTTVFDIDIQESGVAV